MRDKHKQVYRAELLIILVVVVVVVWVKNDLKFKLKQFSWEKKKTNANVYGLLGIC